jgi:hypothetical protein
MLNSIAEPFVLEQLIPDWWDVSNCVQHSVDSSCNAVSVHCCLMEDIMNTCFYLMYNSSGTDGGQCASLVYDRLRTCSLLFFEEWN